MKHKLVLALIVSILSLAAAQPSAATPGSEPAALAASAELQDVDGSVVGDVNITESESADGPLITIQVGLEPESGVAPGEYGFHLHQVGACAPSFDAAGDHINLERVAHGLLSPAGPHSGDLPNVVVADDGTTTYVVSTRLVTLNGDTGLFDEDGSAVMLHAQADDYITDPSGTSGDRVACGVVAEEAAGE